MNKLFNLLKWGITLGPGSQNYLGARWIRKVLDRTPKEKQVKRALQILSLSPHYFFDENNPKYAGMSNDEYLETAFREARHSRELIMAQILKGKLSSGDVVLDYGCGPGFLSRAMAPHVKHVYAADISPGVLACAQILNPAKNLNYVEASPEGLATIENGSIDVAVSFAVLQHVSDDIYEIVLKTLQQKLKPGGRLILHIQLLGGGWKTEEEWRSDRSITGRLRYRYGLHCFARSEASHLDLIKNAGFTDARIESIADLVSENFDDVCSQHLLTAIKPL